MDIMLHLHSRGWKAAFQQELHPVNSENDTQKKKKIKVISLCNKANMISATRAAAEPLFGLSTCLLAWGSQCHQILSPPPPLLPCALPQCAPPPHSPPFGGSAGCLQKRRCWCDAAGSVCAYASGVPWAPSPSPGSLRRPGFWECGGCRSGTGPGGCAPTTGLRKNTEDTVSLRAMHHWNNDYLQCMNAPLLQLGQHKQGRLSKKVHLG